MMKGGTYMIVLSIEGYALCNAEKRILVGVTGAYGRHLCPCLMSNRTCRRLEDHPRDPFRFLKGPHLRRRHHPRTQQRKMSRKMRE